VVLFLDIEPLKHLIPEAMWDDIMMYKIVISHFLMS